MENDWWQPVAVLSLLTAVPMVAHRGWAALVLWCTKLNGGRGKIERGRHRTDLGCRCSQEVAIRTGGDGIPFCLESIGVSAPLRPSDGYEERNGITVLRWCSLTQETSLKGSGTTW
jgi:hypothetical protein